MHIQNKKTEKAHKRKKRNSRVHRHSNSYKSHGSHQSHHSQQVSRPPSRHSSHDHDDHKSEEQDINNTTQKFEHRIHSEPEDNDQDNIHCEDIIKEQDDIDGNSVHFGDLQQKNEYYDFEDVLNTLETELKSQQKEFESSLEAMNENICNQSNNNNNNFTSINLWKKYHVELGEIERDINEFCNNCHSRLNHDLSDDVNTKCQRLKKEMSKIVKNISEIEHVINCDENEIVHIEKTIRSLQIQKIEYQQNIKLKKKELSKEENDYNLSQKQLKKLQHFNNKYEITKKQLNKDISNFEQNEKLKIDDIQKHLNHIWRRFELNYQSWNSKEALQWILCIDKFHFSHNKFNLFIDTLKNHQFIGKNLKELRSTFTLNVMGLNQYQDQQLLIKNINRIITKSRRKSSKMRQQQHQQIQKALNLTKQENGKTINPIFNKRKSNRFNKLPKIHDYIKYDTNDNDTSSSPSDNNGNLCCICAEKEINTVIIPCGHMVYCSKCSKNLTINTCPYCRRENIKIMTTYKSGL